MLDANSLGLVTAFLAGLVSFLAPCVLPLIPGFLAYLAGGVDPAQVRRRDVFINSVFFVLGFSLVFAALGVLLNTLLEAVAYDVQVWLARVGGALIIIFGLYLVGLIRIPFLEREHKFNLKHRFQSRYLTSFVFGLAFAAGWTPCVGPALGIILGLAATAPGSAFALLLAYSLGLGLPFLLVGWFAAEASVWFSRYARAFLIINRVFGVILVGLGILVFTQKLNLIANWELLNSFLLER
jgi:cytochrome c-type biogenesis protein